MSILHPPPLTPPFFSMCPFSNWLFPRLEVIRFIISELLASYALSKTPQIGFQYQLSLNGNAGHKYCRMLQGEHFAILLTFIKLPFVIFVKIFILSIFCGRFTQVLLYFWFADQVKPLTFYTRHNRVLVIELQTFYSIFVHKAVKYFDKLKKETQTIWHTQTHV